MEIFKWLEDKSIVQSFVLNTYRNTKAATYINIKIQLIDSSELHVKEYLDGLSRKYAFHWQKSSGEQIIRWDNAPHFHKLKTFPHHKHIGIASVEESYDISFDDVMKYIKLNLDISIRKG